MGKAAKQQRKKDFDMSSTAPNADGYNEYDPFDDKHLKQYFSRQEIQKNLMKNSLIDKKGELLEWDKHKSRLFIIDQEFSQALKLKNGKENHIKHVQLAALRKREEEAQNRKKKELVEKIKEERKIRKEILRLITVDYSKLRPKSMRKRAKKIRKSSRKQDKSEIFLTENIRGK